MKQALILAGGKGTRLRSRLGDLPKPLVPVGGTPLLQHQLRLLGEHGFDVVLVLVNHGADQIQSWLRSLAAGGPRVRLFDDGEPRGTAGAVLQILPELEEQFAVHKNNTMLN